jgi:hypothetical protein
MKRAYRKRLKDERCFRVVREFRTDVLNASSPFGPKKIEPETILNGIGFRQETGSQQHPLSRVYNALEDRVLYPLSMIFAQPGHAAQPAASSIIAGTYVIANKNHHDCSSIRAVTVFLPPEECWIGI